LSQQMELGQLQVEMRPDRDRVVVAAAGEMDLATVPQLEAAVRDLRESGWANVVVDLRELRFIDSTGLCGLAALMSEARRDGWTLSLVDGSPAVDRLLELSGLRDHFSWARVR
jgi:anti-sigma B factor antagonist